MKAYLPTTVLSLLVACAGSAAASQSVTTRSLPIDAKESAIERYGELPLSFEANLGQSDSEVKFLSRGQGYNLFLTSNEAVLALRKPGATGAAQSDRYKGEMATDTAVVRMRLSGAQDVPAITGLEPLPGNSHYFMGSEPQQWRTAVPHYGKVKYSSVYPGIDLVYYGNQRELEYDFVVAPGADPKLISLAYQGVEKLRIDAQGNLLLHTTGGVLTQQAPIVYQEIDGARTHIDGRYVIGENRQVSFQLASYDAGKPLVIDPVLSYSTYLGGSDADLGLGITIDAAGSAYITGETRSTNFPTVNAVQNLASTSGDAFVTKLSPTGNSLVYSTYLAGNGRDRGEDIALDRNGNAYLAGSTTSTNFPTRNPTQAAAGGFGDAFVTQFAPAGNMLIFSTYLGGNGSGLSGEGSDLGYAIAVDQCGVSYVTGQTTSPAFPTVTPFQAGRNGVSDAFITRIAPSNSIMLQFSAATYSVSETSATATITVTRCGSRTGTVAVKYATSNGTALSGSDYAPASGTLTFATNEVSKTFTVGIVNDATVEASETVRLTLSGPTGAILGTPNTATLTILDNEPAQLRFSSATYSANETSLKAIITVSRIGSLTGTSSAKYATANGTATAGADYTAATGTVSFTAGISSKTFTVPIINDTTAEGNETVNLALSAPVGATLAAPSSAALTIVSNE